MSAEDEFTKPAEESGSGQGVSTDAVKHVQLAALASRLPDNAIIDSLSDRLTSELSPNEHVEQVVVSAYGWGTAVGVLCLTRSEIVYVQARGVLLQRARTIRFTYGDIDRTSLMRTTHSATFSFRLAGGKKHTFAVQTTNDDDVVLIIRLVRRYAHDASFRPDGEREDRLLQRAEH